MYSYLPSFFASSLTIRQSLRYPILIHLTCSIYWLFSAWFCNGFTPYMIYLLTIFSLVLQWVYTLHDLSIDYFQLGVAMGLHLTWSIYWLFSAWFCNGFTPYMLYLLTIFSLVLQWVYTLHDLSIDYFQLGVAKGLHLTWSIYWLFSAWCCNGFPHTAGVGDEVARIRRNWTRHQHYVLRRGGVDDDTVHCNNY